LLMSVAAIGLVNAANMADGQNGLLTGMFAIWALCLSLVASADSYCPLVLLGASLIVFAFNLPGRLFLGDCGSYGVTFVIAMLSIRAHAVGALTVATVVAWFFIPVVDCLRLMISRRLSGRSPLSADRDHFHHRLEAKLGASNAVAIYLGTVAVTSILAAVIPEIALVCIAALVVFYTVCIWLTAEGRPQPQIVYRFDRAPNPVQSATVLRLTKAPAEADARPEFADAPYGASVQEAALPFAERPSARHVG